MGSDETAVTINVSRETFFSKFTECPELSGLFRFNQVTVSIIDFHFLLVNDDKLPWAPINCTKFETCINLANHIVSLLQAVTLCKKKN